MKFLKGLIISIFIVAVLLFIGVYIFLKSFDVNKYRPQIVAELNKQLGRNVTIDNVGLNFSILNGVYAQVLGVKVSEEPSFGQGDFASVGAVKLNVDILAYLTQRKIVISKIAIDDLKVKIIRDHLGALNVQKIGPPQKTTQAADQSLDKPTEKISQITNSKTDLSIPNFSVNTIAVSNAELLFVDNGSTVPMQIAASAVDLTVKNFSLSQPFSFEGHLAVFGLEKNLTITGQAAVNLLTQQATLSQVQVQVDFAKLKVSDLLKSLPQLKAAGLKDPLEGKLAIQIPSLNAGAQGLGDLKVTGQLQNAKVITQLLPVAIDKITSDFVADAKNIEVKSFSLQLLNASVSVQADIKDYLASQRLDAQIKLVDVALSSLVAGLPQSMKLGGTINGELALKAEHLSAPDKFLNSLNGAGEFSVNNGKIENFNFLKTVLSRIEFIPGLSTMVEAGMPQAYLSDYQSNETVFQKISSSVRITNGVANLPDFVVLSNLFEADMQITADTKLNGKVSGQIKLPLDLSAYLVSQAKALTYLKNSDGHIMIALTSFEGPLAKLKIMPDVKALGKAALEGEGVNQLNKLLNKALKVDDKSAPEGESSPGSSTKELIGGVLDKIFK